MKNVLRLAEGAPLRIPVALIALLGGWASSVRADKKPGDHLPEIFTGWNHPSTSGCPVAISQHRRITFEHGYRQADLEHAVSITPATPCRVACQAVTAAAIALLARQGKLSLDDAIRKFVPELADYGKPIAIRELIHRTSGLRDYWHGSNDD